MPRIAGEKVMGTSCFMGLLRSQAAALLPAGHPLRSKVERSVAELIDGDAAVMYRVPGDTPPAN